jgi:hypothetical protein
VPIWQLVYGELAPVTRRKPTASMRHFVKVFLRKSERHRRRTTGHPIAPAQIGQTLELFSLGNAASIGCSAERGLNEPPQYYYDSVNDIVLAL